MIERLLYAMNLAFYVAGMAWRTSAKEKRADITYACLRNSQGVPILTVVVGQGREAWRVSTFAVDALKDSLKRF